MVPPVVVSTGVDPAKLYYSQKIQQKYRTDAPDNRLAKKAEPEADIQFNPDLDTFLARSAKRTLAGGLEKAVPNGWPASLSGRLAWKGSNFEDESSFIYRLSDEEKEEISRALSWFKDQELDGNDVSAENFPLPTLAPRLAAVSEEVYNGLGAVILRGLDVDQFSPPDLATVFLGVSSYIARKRGVQDRNGTMIKHLMDNGAADSQAELPLHTDVTCDIVATLTRQCSTEGGMCTIASSWTIYNELAATRPDLIHVLARPDWPFDTFGREPPYYNRALLFYTDGKAILNFSRRVLTGHPYEPRSQSIPRLSEAQADALDSVHYIAKEHQMKLTMEKGDMRFINNTGLLHGREAFFDNGREKSKRHLLRLWLHDEEKAWTLPPALRLAWARVFEDDERVTRWDIEPVRVNGVLMCRSSSPCD
ncbi:taurine catabolism dioxygenase [Diplodia corticola]|uniref:Taurine catabolism dioxygenase n=1 Tax=Diplodia corticola TaxID=236234 RepID=A0A1J9QNS8_9PEZI|nr:taurine catabolism dioxygenase [Diplodia corticola]OJD30105.1 taurine catabolism dioxygenase [Diplodia corticola]